MKCTLTYGGVVNAEGQESMLSTGAFQKEAILF